MTIVIKTLTLGIASTNAYLVGDTTTGSCIVIDPVDDAALLYRTAEEAGWRIQLILATHAHFDHVLASAPLKAMTGAPFYIHGDCVPALTLLPQQGRLFGLMNLPEAAEPDRLLTTESETLVVDGIELRTLYTPGHAEGHVCFYLEQEKIVFAGDTLFAGSIGRTDLPNGNYAVLMRSIFGQLIPLGDDVAVYAGHMQATTIGRERKTNPFLLSYDAGDI